MTNLKEAPIYSKKVLRIYKMREKGKTFEEIGAAMKPPMSRMGAWTNYNRWKSWAAEQCLIEKQSS